MNKNISTVSIWKIIKEAASKIGVENAHSHMLRHSFTSILNQKKCHPKVIEILRGDSPSNMVSYYSHFTFEDIRTAYLAAMPMLLA